MTSDGLGISLDSLDLDHEVFDAPHSVGCRYWIAQNDRLLPPVGVGVQGVWMPGLNRGRCGTEHPDHASWKSCGCGLYCFKYTPGLRRVGDYFDLETATPSWDGDGVVGGIAYWSPRQHDPTPGTEIVSARYAAVAALMMPQKATREKRQVVKRLARVYSVEIVEPSELAVAVDAWVAEHLPLCYEPWRKPQPVLRRTWAGVVPTLEWMPRATPLEAEVGALSV